MPSLGEAGTDANDDSGNSAETQTSGVGTGSGSTLSMEQQPLASSKGAVTRLVYYNHDQVLPSEDRRTGECFFFVTIFLFFLWK